MGAARKLIWIAEGGFHGWGCSECVWVFTSSDALTGKSFNELMQNFEAQRDKEFASHFCTEHPRTQERKTLNNSNCGFRKF